jgi:hypothetical protein
MHHSIGVSYTTTTLNLVVIIVSNFTTVALNFVEVQL